jgi:hypothetical protein
MKRYLIFILLILSQSLLAETGGWVTRSGKSVPDSESMKSIDGFGGRLLVTPDNDWEAKWDTPPETVPYFREATSVGYGEQITILTFYLNPGIDQSGEIHIICDIKVMRPDGSASFDQSGIDCAKGDPQGDLRNVRLTSAIINYIGEEGDPPGVWTVHVNLVDKNRNLVMPLTTKFELVANKDVSTESLEDFGYRMSYFYIAPSREAFSDFQRGASQFKRELEGAGNGADLLVSVMIAKISEKYDWPISDGAFSANANEILAGKSRLSKYLIDDSQVDPTKLDVWWASFFATGEEHYLENIIQYAGLELPKSDIGKMLVIGAATWSFRANCRQHKKVLEFAKRKLSSVTDNEPQMEFLRDCITFAESGDGDEDAPPGPPEQRATQA